MNIDAILGKKFVLYINDPWDFGSNYGCGPFGVVVEEIGSAPTGSPRALYLRLQKPFTYRRCEFDGLVATSRDGSLDNDIHRLSENETGFSVNLCPVPCSRDSDRSVFELADSWRSWRLVGSLHLKEAPLAAQKISSQNREEEANALYDRAHILSSDGRHAEAADIFSRLLNEFADELHEWNLHLRLGWCYLRMWEHRKAIDHHLRAYETIPKQEDGLSFMLTLKDLADAYSHLGEYDAALKYAEEGEQYVHYFDVPDRQSCRFEYRLKKGRIYFLLDRYRDALRQFKRLKKLIPDNGDVEEYHSRIGYELGQTYLRLKKRRKAYSILAKVNPAKLEKTRYLDLHYSMLVLCCLLKRHREAVRHFEKLEELDLPEEYAALTYFYAGVSYYGLWDGPNARKCLEESEKYPCDADWLEDERREFLEALTKFGQ
ncbi:MAG: tetratricopeptide repeat protein [Candidatus Zixiibacteriota bacterium]|nr:MAG: tetratricopeptide repeat protein [candidate division Zixibacteria bacterium]